MKNLLILRYIDTKAWDWNWAMNQFGENRAELAKQERHVGFTPMLEAATNGNGHH